MYAKFCDVPAARVAVCPNVGWTPPVIDGEAMLEGAFDGRAISPSNNYNWPQLDVPAVNRAFARLDGVTASARRAQLAGRIDRLIAAQAPAVPWLWTSVANIESANVRGVIARWNATWDVSYTWLA
jgi:peptide/nickel transport system substrate-binding protein